MPPRKYRPVCIDGEDVYIPLNDEHTEFAVVSLEDWEWMEPKGYVSWYLNSNGYPRGYYEGKKRYLHQVLVQAEAVDHIDHDRLNNRRNNLRPANKMLNMRNMLRRPTTKYAKGVSKTGGKRNKCFQARIRVEGKRRSLGVFLTPEEAAAAYDKAAIEIFGEFAYTNEMADRLENRPLETSNKTTRRNKMDNEIEFDGNEIEFDGNDFEFNVIKTVEIDTDPNRGVYCNWLPDAPKIKTEGIKVLGVPRKGGNIEVLVFVANGTEVIYELPAEDVDDLGRALIQAAYNQQHELA